MKSYRDLKSDTQTPSDAQLHSANPAPEPVWLDPQGLRVGQAFIVSKETPLMPEFEPSDPIAALQQAKRIPKGGAFKISEIRQKNFCPWYRVIVINQNNKQIVSGWINSAALFGQDLKPFNR